jgi:hypothetical protein
MPNAATGAATRDVDVLIFPRGAASYRRLEISGSTDLFKFKVKGSITWIKIAQVKVVGLDPFAEDGNEIMNGDCL